MTDLKTNDTTGDRINKAVAEERRRIMASKVSIKVDVGFTTVPHPMPQITIVMSGGDPDKLKALGLKLAMDAFAGAETCEAIND